MLGQENARIFLISNELTSYVECLASFGEKGADQAVVLILQGVEGEKIPLNISNFSQFDAPTSFSLTPNPQVIFHCGVENWLPLIG